MISMRALEWLVTIVDQGSLTQAAAVLHLSQPVPPTAGPGGRLPAPPSCPARPSAVASEPGCPAGLRPAHAPSRSATRPARRDPPTGASPQFATQGLIGVVKGEKQMPSLKDRTVLIVGRGSGIAGAIALAVGEEGGRIIAAGLHPDDLADSYRGMDFGIEHVDVTDESSIAALAGRIAKVDHVVSTASARARGGYGDLTASLVNASFGTKVTGAILLAKHFAGKLASDGSFLFMSGATALKPAPGMLAVAATNAVTAGLAVPWLDQGQRHRPRDHRHRRVRRPRGGTQGRAVHGAVGEQSGPAHRHGRRHRGRRAGRPDQRIPDRGLRPGRRRRAPRRGMRVRHACHSLQVRRH